MFFLDEFSPANLQVWRKRADQVAEFHWDFYSYLALRRSRIAEKLHGALFSAAKPYEFLRWARIVTFKYSNHPLSAAGSTGQWGGRFNIGRRVDDTRFTTFPCLYLAEDFVTAFCEKFALAPEHEEQGLTIGDLALTRQTAITQVLVNGSFENLLDVGDVALTEFVKLIAGFKLPKTLRSRAQRLGANVPLVRNLGNLQKGLLVQNWRIWPAAFEVPAPSQIFGQLARAAGVEAILFPSTRTSKQCLAIFPENLRNGSFVEIEGDRPASFQFARLDRRTWKDFI